MAAMDAVGSPGYSVGLWGQAGKGKPCGPPRRCRVPGQLLLPARPGHSSHGTLELGDGGTWPWLSSAPRPVLGAEGGTVGSVGNVPAAQRAPSPG